MKVNGEWIVITDPCYIAKDEDWGQGFDYYENSIDPSLGFSDYMLESTGSDGSWSVFETNRKESLGCLSDLLRNIYEEDEEDFEYKLKGTKVGTYSADAGLTSVFFYDEIVKYGPLDDLDELVEKGCAVIIKDFVGEIYTFFDDSDQLHFIGIGNKSFYTV